MIMAGRGRRLTEPGDEQNKVGASQVTSEITPADVPTLTKKISEINTNDINQSLLTDIQKMIKETFTSEDVMRLFMSKFHSQALDDVEFGEKLIVTLENILRVEAGSTSVRNLLLSLIQNDFNDREVNFKSNPKKFVNSVMLLGNVFNIIKIGGKPISVLAPALFECLNLLLKGEEEELKTVVKQILINGSKLLENDLYKQFMQNLRDTLVTRNLNTSSKCWLLLAIEFTSNGFQPLKEGSKDFYVANLGDEYKKFELLIPVPKEPIIHLPVSLGSVKSQEDACWRAVKLNSVSSEEDNYKKDLQKKFSNMNVTSGSGRKVQSPPGKNQKKDPWKSSGGMRRSSGHDDRFEREENFYGVQKPRQPKPENQKKKFNDEKNIKKEFHHFMTDADGKVEELQTQPVKGEHWG